MAYSQINQERIEEIRKRGPRPVPVMERLWRLVQRGGEDECWLWKTANSNKTPTIVNNGLVQIAYRLVFENTYRSLNKGEWVLHTCDNNRCMNPRHLYVGDRVIWARKWHSVEYNEEHHAELIQRHNDRVKQRYQRDPESIKRYNNKRALELKLRAIAYLGGKCMHCGYDHHPAAFHFHHRDPTAKTFEIGSSCLRAPKKYPWDAVIVPELNKCDLLCANCHAEVHAAFDYSQVLELMDGQG